MKSMLTIFTIFTVIACANRPMRATVSDQVGEENTLYTIAQGRHRSNHFSWKKHRLERLEFSFQFDSTAIYKTTSPVNQGDINKLYGLSDGTIFHHKNSARFGWRWYNDQLEIWAYIYNNRKRDYKKIGMVDLNKKHKASIIFAANQYVFQLNGKTLEMPRFSSEPMASGYKLLPYFGGDEKAPQQIRILIEEE